MIWSIQFIRIGSLKECPFCGNRRLVMLSEIPLRSAKVRCVECGAVGPPGTTVPEANENWDKRLA